MYLDVWMASDFDLCQIKYMLPKLQIGKQKNMIYKKYQISGPLSLIDIQSHILFIYVLISHRVLRQA